MITANDELSHQPDDHPRWRESNWHCFQDPDLGLAGAFYYSYEPNAEEPSAALSFYLVRGMGREPNAPLYHYRQTFPIPEGSWDDLDVGGVGRFRRVVAGREWTLGFDDGEGTRLEVEATYFAGAWDYRNNVHPTPANLATDRYHRPWRASGELILRGERIELDCTGDADHSWGPRLWGELHQSKYVAGQCGDDLAFQLFLARDAEGAQLPYGFVWDADGFSPVTDVEMCPTYGEAGIHDGAVLNIVDGDRRMTRVTAEGFAAYPSDRGDVWNNDVYAEIEVNGDRQGSGIFSFHWERERYVRLHGLDGSRSRRPAIDPR